MTLQERINADPEIKALFEEKDAEIQQLKALNEALQRQLAEVMQRLALLEQQLAGKELNPAPAANRTGSRERSRRRKKKSRPSADKKKPKRAPLPEHLERIEQIETIEVCPSGCDGGLTELGEEVSERLEYVPAKLVVRRLIRKRVVCRCCRRITTAPLPSLAIPYGQYGASLLAHIAYAKCGLHLPLARIAEDLARQGVELPSSSLCGMVEQAADLLQPVWRALKAEVFSDGLLQTDATGIDLLSPGEPGKSRGCMTVYCTDGVEPISVFDFSETKAGAHLKSFLQVGEVGGYSGYLVADASSTMDVLYEDGSIIECGCWQHARENFVSAAACDPRVSLEGLSFIKKLFESERVSDEQDETAAERLARRRRESAPLLARFEVWLSERAKKYIGGEEMLVAIRYIGNHRAALWRFLDDGRIPIHNNLSERELSVIGRGRKNYLFAGSLEGGKRLAVLYSVVRTCQRLGVDPWLYLSEVLPRLSALAVNRGLSRRLDELLPMAFKKTTQQRQAG